MKRKEAGEWILRSNKTEHMVYCCSNHKLEHWAWRTKGTRKNSIFSKNEQTSISPACIRGITKTSSEHEATQASVSCLGLRRHKIWTAQWALKKFRMVSKCFELAEAGGNHTNQFVGHEHVVCRTKLNLEKCNSESELQNLVLVERLLWKTV
jgi:hypothetical protein